MDNNSDNDKELWLNIIQGVKKLKKKPRLKPNIFIKLPKPKEKSDSTFNRTIEFTNTFETLPKLISGNLIDADRKTVLNLKRGDYPINAKLDLHGFIQEHAYIALYNFIINSYKERKRCLLIITGKGKSSENSGVIKKRIPEWLNNVELRQLIIGFTSAQLRHGGEGAIYVLLRKNKN